MSRPTRLGARRSRWGRPSRGFPSLVAVGVLAAAALLAPMLDDARSRLRAMETGCRVARVIDGDTVDLACPGQTMVRARIVGYDAPELFSPGCAAEAAAAEAARAGLAALTLGGGRVEVAALGRDRYDRALVDMRVGGARVATRMVAEGHGRRYLGGARGGWCGWG